MKLRGTIGRSDLEGGYLTFDDGERIYKLEGGGDDLRRVGVRAEIDGQIQSASMGIGFGTPVLQVKGYAIL